VNVDQLTRNVFELSRRRRTAVDPGPAFPLKIDDAAQQQAVADYIAGFVKPISQV